MCLNTIYNEINNGRPILLSGKKRNSNQKYHWVLAYGYGFGNASKQYQRLLIIDTAINDIVYSKNYQFEYRYIKVNGEHYYEQNKKRDEIVKFAKQFIGKNTYQIDDFVNKKYGKNSFWTNTLSFEHGYDWCCYFATFCYNRCGMNK